MPSSPVPLPPCQVCDDAASGIHYGVSTCQACKRFFWRCLQRRPEDKCAHGGKCNISLENRNSCTACRYKKCLSVGMSKTAMKPGRRTHERNRDLIIEYKHSLKKQSGQTATEQQNSPIASSPESNHSSDSDVSMQDVQEAVDEEKEIEKVIANMKEVYAKQRQTLEELLAQVPSKEENFLENKQLEKEVFDLNPISPEEYMEIYKSTGIDIGGRRAIIEEMIPVITESIHRFISFAKEIPGYKKLPMDDQVALIKAGRFENWIFEAHQCFNVQKNLYTPLRGSVTYHKDDIGQVRGTEWTDSLFRLVQRIQDLHLTLEESFVARSVAILFIDRCDLKQAQVVNESQQLLIKCLNYMFKRNHPEDLHLFTKFILILTEMRTLGNYHSKNEQKIVDEYPSIPFPPIFQEIWKK